VFPQNACEEERQCDAGDREEACPCLGDHDCTRSLLMSLPSTMMS
jgi:hypothetical protein